MKNKRKIKIFKFWFFRTFFKNVILIFNENFDFPKNNFRKCSIFFLKNNFRSQKNNIFWWNFFYSNPMSRPSSSCIFGSSGPVEVSERGSYIVGILLCFLKKVGHTLLSRIISCICHPYTYSRLILWSIRVHADLVEVAQDVSEVRQGTPVCLQALRRCILTCTVSKPVDIRKIRSEKIDPTLQHSRPSTIPHRIRLWVSS